MISNCHLGDNEHVRIDLCYFSIFTEIRIDQWFSICGLGILRDARRILHGIRGYIYLTVTLKFTFFK